MLRVADLCLTNIPEATANVVVVEIGRLLLKVSYILLFTGWPKKSGRLGTLISFNVTT